MCGQASARVCWHVFTVMSLVPPLSISMSPPQLSQIMSRINKDNVCVPADPDCTRTVPRPGILNMSTSPVTTLTVVTVVINIFVYDAKRLFIELIQLTTVSFDIIE